MSLPAYVINLESRRDRLRHVRHEFELVGLDFKLIEAVPADAVESTEVATTGQSPGKIACWMSHRRAWRHAQDSGATYCLVVEDDVRWLRNPGPLLDRIGSLPPDAFDLLQLGSLQRGPRSVPARARWAHKAAKSIRVTRVLSRRSEVVERWFVERSQLLSRSLDDVEMTSVLEAATTWGSFGSGTHAYVVSRQFLSHLLKYNQPVFLSADDALSALAHQQTFRIGELTESIATQAPLASDLR
jgi:GR25 family glycosyltransferase involved in LPS biosynthesis